MKKNHKPKSQNFPNKANYLCKKKFFPWLSLKYYLFCMYLNTVLLIEFHDSLYFARWNQSYMFTVSMFFKLPGRSEDTLKKYLPFFLWLSEN